jgi:hypothetical protein
MVGQGPQCLRDLPVLRTWRGADFNGQLKAFLFQKNFEDEPDATTERHVIIMRINQYVPFFAHFGKFLISSQLYSSTQS